MGIFKPVKLKHHNFMEYVMRGISGPIARILAKTPITPNQVTLSRVPLMGFVFYGFSSGEYQNMVWSAWGIVLYEILDHVDGDLAFLTHRSSKFGEWLERICDQSFGTVSGFLGMTLTIGLCRQTQTSTPWFVYGVLACGWYLFKAFLKEDSLIETTVPLKAELLEKKEKSLLGKIAHFCYYWVELFIIPAVLVYPFFKTHWDINSIFILMIGYAIMYNLFWMYILVNQYQRFRQKGVP